MTHTQTSRQTLRHETLTRWNVSRVTSKDKPKQVCCETSLIVNEKMEDETDPRNQFAEKHKLRSPVLLRSNSI